MLTKASTSHFRDEAICVSTLLGLEPAEVLTATNGRTLKDEERMKRLWEIVPAERVPTEILFCNRPFYDQKGCGWMPKSLLHNSTGNQLEHLSCGMTIRKYSQYDILINIKRIIFNVDAEYGPKTILHRQQSNIIHSHILCL